MSLLIAPTVSDYASRLVVILVGRLRLSPSRAVEAYLRLVTAIPTRAAESDEGRRRNTEAFKAVLSEVLEASGFDQNMPMLEDGAKI
jgi:hypothetical protein